MHRLPALEEITPLSQPLIPHSLAWAFGIPTGSANANGTNGDLALRATTTDYIRVNIEGPGDCEEEEVESLEWHEKGDKWNSSLSTRAENLTNRINEEAEERPDIGRGRSGSNSPRTSTTTTTTKRPRLMWTPQLHKRFVDVVARIGVHNAVPKAIMQLMNVDGLTRENVASHLQKYRLHLKRVPQGLSPAAGTGHCLPGHLVFASIPNLTPLSTSTSMSASGLGLGLGLGSDSGLGLGLSSALALASAPAPAPARPPPPQCILTLFPTTEA